MVGHEAIEASASQARAARVGPPADPGATRRFRARAAVVGRGLAFSSCLASFALGAACRPTGGTPPPCPPPPGWTASVSPAAVVVVDVGAQVVTAERIRARLGRDFGEPPTLAEAIEEEVRFSLFLQAAIDRGLARDPEVIDHAQRVMVRRLLADELSDFTEAPPPDEAALRAAYEAHRAQYVRPPRRRLAGLQFGRSEAERVRAQHLIEAPPVPVPAAFLSRWRHAHPEVQAVAELGGREWWEPAALAEAVGREAAERIMAATVGALVPEVLTCPRGFCVAHVVEEREGRVRDFDDVRDEVRERLEHSRRGEQFERFATELRGIYPVRVHPERERELADAWPRRTGHADG